MNTDEHGWKWVKTVHLQLPNASSEGFLSSEELPMLADCPKLRMLGVKDNKLASLEGDRLPVPRIPWLLGHERPLTWLLGPFRSLGDLGMAHRGGKRDPPPVLLSILKHFGSLLIRKEAV